jgi:hypothetical protein
MRDVNTFLVVGKPEDLGVDAIAQLDARIRQTLGPRITRAKSQDDVEKAFMDLEIYGENIPKDMVERYREEIGTYSPDADWSKRVEAALHVDEDEVGTQWEFFSKALGYSSAPNLMSVDGLLVAKRIAQTGDSSLLDMWHDTRGEYREATGDALRSRVTPDHVSSMDEMVDDIRSRRRAQEAQFDPAKDNDGYFDSDGDGVFEFMYDGERTPIVDDWDVEAQETFDVIEDMYDLPPESAQQEDFLLYLDRLKGQPLSEEDRVLIFSNPETLKEMYDEYIGSERGRTPRRGSPFAWDKVSLIKRFRKRAGLAPYPSWLNLSSE